MVLGRVAIASRYSSSQFDDSVDGLGGAAACVRVVELRWDVPRSPFEYPAQRDDLGQIPRYACGSRRINFRMLPGLARSRLECAATLDDVPVDAPGDRKGKKLNAGQCDNGKHGVTQDQRDE